MASEEGIQVGLSDDDWKRIAEFTSKQPWERSADDLTPK